MTNDRLSPSEFEEFVRIIKGYQAQQEARDRVRRARHAQIQKAKDRFVTLLQQAEHHFMRGDD